jgi:hypothetical protein
MPNCQRDGIAFHYRDTGQGLPFVFQHGLGGRSSKHVCSIIFRSRGFYWLA